MKVLLSLALCVTVSGCASTLELLGGPTTEENRDTTGQYDGTWSASYETKNKIQRVVSDGKFIDFNCDFKPRKIKLTILDGRVSGKMDSYEFEAFVNEEGHLGADAVYSNRDKQTRKDDGLINAVQQDWLFGFYAQLDSQTSEGTGTERFSTPKAGPQCTTSVQLKKS